MSARSISFRQGLLANVLDLLSEANLHCTRTANLAAEIVSSLVGYAEEGVRLFPTVFICNSVEELVGRGGTGEYIPLSGEIAIDNAASVILKRGAPLCSDNWRIYVQRNSDGSRCSFGVFCGSSDPASLTIDDILLTGTDTEFPVVRLAHSGVNRIEVRNNAGGRIEFRFNADAEETYSPSQTRIHDLSVAIASGLTGDISAFVGYVERLLTAAIQHSHGTLIAVVPDGSHVLPTVLSDAVELHPPIDLFDRFSSHMSEGRTASSMSRLQAASEIMAGIIGSDGITVLNSKGQAIAFRAFIKNAPPAEAIVGGARSRAFAALQQLVGKELVAAFARSQDGQIQLKLALPEVANE